MKDCAYCKNAYTDSGLDHTNDLSYLSIGESAEKVNAYIRSGGNMRTAIVIEKNKQVVWLYRPKYCPNCGRELKENKRWQSYG